MLVSWRNIFRITRRALTFLILLCFLYGSNIFRDSFNMIKISQFSLSRQSTREAILDISPRNHFHLLTSVKSWWLMTMIERKEAISEIVIIFHRLGFSFSLPLLPSAWRNQCCWRETGQKIFHDRREKSLQSSNYRNFLLKSFSFSSIKFPHQRRFN